ncbi:MAG: hypothetical protein ACTSSM_06650 [Promethearchaeota archaeon]
MIKEKIFEKNGIFEDFNIIPLKKGLFIPDMEDWEKYRNEKYPREKLKSHKGDFAVICGKISNHLTVLSFTLKEEKFTLKEEKNDFIKEIIYEIRKVKPIAGTTYIEEDDSTYNIFYHVKDCRFDERNFFFPIREGYNKYIKYIRLYSEGNYCKLSKSLNSISIKAITNEELEKIIKIFAYLIERHLEISVEIARKPRGGIYSIHSTKEGIIFRNTRMKWDKHRKDYIEENFDQKILDVPFFLKNVYEDINGLRFYEVKLGKEIICMKKVDLLKFIENERNYAYVSGKELKNFISIVLNEYQKVRKLEPKKNMYPAIGIFLDKNDEITLVYPGISGIILYGTNGYQKRIIERCEKKGIDEDGNLCEAFYYLFHDETYPLKIRLVTFGHQLISSFFNVLREDLDIFPDHLWLTPQKSVGKTEFFKLMYCYCFGEEIKNNDDIDSIARLTEMCTSSTFAQCIDDIDELDKKILSYWKSAGTTLKGKERMTANQEVKIQETYKTFS